MGMFLKWGKDKERFWSNFSNWLLIFSSHAAVGCYQFSSQLINQTLQGLMNSSFLPAQHEGFLETFPVSRKRPLTEPQQQQQQQWWYETQRSTQLHCGFYVYSPSSFLTWEVILTLHVCALLSADSCWSHPGTGTINGLNSAWLGNYGVDIVYPNKGNALLCLHAL